MREALRKKRSLVRALEQRIDPRPPVAGKVDMILTCVKAAGFESGAGSHELHEARRGVSTLWRLVRDLNRMDFWKSLTVPRSQKSRAPEAIQEQLANMLETAHLDVGDVTRGEVLAAMDALHEVVIWMNTMFAAGRVRAEEELDESWTLDRYTCAALLPVLAEVLASFWAELRTGSGQRGVKA